MKPFRKSPRSATGLTKLNLATGLAGALALTSGALAQTADATHAMDGATVETHQTTASGVTLNMDAGLSAVALGSTTAASGKTITNAGTLTATVDVVQIQQGSGNTIINESTGTISSNLSVVAAGSTTTGTAITNGGRISGAGADATIDMQGTTAGITNTGIIENTGTGSAVVLQTALDGASITNSGTITTLNADAIHLVGAIGGAQPGAVVNTSTGIINAGGGNGIFAGGIAENGSITNSGIIDAFDSGVDVFARSVVNAAPESATGSIEPSAPVANRGTILNSSEGTITSGSDGVRLFGENAGTVTNAGTITAGSSGIYALGMGSGMPTGAPEAAAIFDGPVVANSGQISNSGTITAEYNGIYLRGENSGSVTNSGSITADEGLYVNGSTIETALTDDTVSVTRFANRGTVANAKDASLTTDYEAIVLRGENSGTVTNAGAVESQYGDGIYVNNSRRIIDTSAEAGAAESPSEVSFAAAVANSGTIENTGSIVASNGTGMSIEGENAQGAQIVNAGTIEASQGIRAVTSMRGVYDKGSLESGIAEPAVDLSAAVANHGTITNAQTGSILTTSNGISLIGQNAATGVVSNAGQIKTGPSANGISVANAELMYKMYSASSETETEPTRLVANRGLIENSATGTMIVGNSGLQSIGENAGTLRNAGRIEAAAGMVSSSAGFFLNRAAMAEGDAPTNVYSNVANRGTIENVEGATIVASAGGIMIAGENAGAITNAGIITADVGVLGIGGVRIVDGTVVNSGTIANTATGKITADISGLLLIGQNTGTITNAGSIKVTTGNGIDVTNDLSLLSGIGAGAPLVDTAETTWVANTGTIENVAGGIIDAEWHGIHANGRNTGTISNAGTIKAGAAGIDVASVLEEPMLGAATVAPGDAEAASVMNSGAIVNSGTIEAAIVAVSVRGDNTGSISNLASGTMSSGTSSAVLIDGDNSGTITNAGSIVSRDYDGIAIRGDNSGTIRNTATGSVTSVYPAVTVRGDNTGIIENAGQLTSTNIAGVSVMGANAKNITNTATGSITSTDGNGISVMGRARWQADEPEAPAVAANSGTITNAGSIKAGASGMLVGTGVRFLEGAVEAAELEDSTLANSGTITNAAGASIEAGETGIRAAGENSGTITNAGSIKAGQAGIAVGPKTISSASPEAITAETTTLANSGTITNAAGASIEAGTTGILAAGENSGTITNAGSIKAASIGVLVGSESPLLAGAESDDAEPVPVVTNSGTITNAAGATIDAGTVGVLVTGENTGTIANAGSIKAIGGIAVLADNSGTITNTGHIEAVVAGALIAANSGTITNALGASIVAESVGVFISGDSGILTNAGDITAGSAGFVVGGDATTLQNSGNITVTATNARAISVAGSATTLANSGTITSAGHGIMVAGDVGSFTNSGTITTTGGEGTAAVQVTGSVTGSVLNSGTVSSTAGGVEVIGTVAGDVTNTGKIEAVSSGLAVVGAGGGNLVNSGTVVATESTAVQIGGSIKDLTNSGAISGNAGIQVGGGVTGDLTNTNTITATVADGVHVVGAVTGAIKNSGDITAAGNGVVLEDGLTGSLTNTGTITAKNIGVSVTGNTNAITNDGTISGAAGIQVLGSVTGDLTNSGTITGQDTGVAVAGGVDGAIRNSGTITGDEGLALLVLGTAKSIDNSGKITGANGAVIFGSVSGNVTNSGTIQATESGLIVLSSAEVINTGTVTASEVGIYAMSAQGVSNSGTITVTGENAQGIYTKGSAVVTNRGTVSANGADSAAIVLAGDAQTLINSGSIASDNLAIASNGGDRVVFAAPSASSGAIGQVTGAIASSGADSTLYFGAAHDVTASSDLLASRADNFRMSYGGSITNFGAVFLAGATDLTGASQFNSSAVLAGAKLSANGTLEFSGSAPMPAGVTLPATAPASVQLYNAGTLGGNGTLRLRSADGGLGTLLNTGTLAPGNSIGHLTVDGNVAHSGALDIEVNPASGAAVAGVDNDLVSVRSGVSGETATFTFAAGSTVNFVATSAAGESLPGTVYNFLSADSSAKIVIEGTSVAVNQLLVASDNLPDYTFYVVSDETNMSDLRNLYAVAARDHALDKFAISESQSETGRFISSNENNEAMKELVTNLALTPGNADLNLALERLSGEIYPSLVTLEQDRASDVMRDVAANLRPTSVAASAEVGARPVWSTFGEMTGAKGEYDDGNVAELDRTYYGALAGVDCKLSSRLNVGGFVNAADGKVDNHHPDRADFTAFDVGLYGRYNREGDYYYASLSYGVADYDVTRQAAVARTSALFSQPAVVTSADVDSSQFTALFEKGYTFKLGERHYLQPYAAFQFSQVCFDSFTEKNGGALGLRVDLDDYTSVLGSLGVAWQYDFNGMLAARVHAAWSHECDEQRAEMEATFAGANGTYHLKGLELGEDRFNFGLGLDAQVSDRVLAYLRADYTVSDGKSAGSAQAGMRYSW